MASHALLNMWGDEFRQLSQYGQALVTEDYLGASYEDQRDYAKNIGRGNLASYAECLHVQATRDARVKTCEGVDF